MVERKIKNVKIATDEELNAEYERLEHTYEPDEIYRNIELDEYYSSICNEMDWRNSAGDDLDYD